MCVQKKQEHSCLAYSNVSISNKPSSLKCYFVHLAQLTQMTIGIPVQLYTSKHDYSEILVKYDT